MKAYIKLLHSENINTGSNWLNNPIQAFFSLSTEDKWNFLINQCAVLGFYRMAYEGDSTTNIRDYRCHIANLVSSMPESKVLSSKRQWCEYLLGSTKVAPSGGLEAIQVLANTIEVWNSEEINPLVVTNEALIPMLHFMQTRDYVKSVSRFNKVDLLLQEHTQSVAIPVINMIDRYGQVEFLPVGEYSCSKESFINEVLVDSNTSFFGYIANISQYQDNLMNSTIVYANLVIDNDMESLVDRTGPGLLYLKVKYNYGILDDNSIEINQYAVDKLTKARFVDCLHRLIKEQRISLEGIINAANVVTNPNIAEDQTLLEYLQLADKSMATMEQLSVLKESCFAKIPNIDTSYSMEAPEGGVMPEAPEGEEGGYPEGMEEEAGTPGEDPYAAQQPMGFGQQQEPTEETEPEPEEDEDLELGDETGIRLELAKGETLESYIFRRELDQHLRTLLNNPPAFLDSNRIQYLRDIRIKWLNLLSIKCVMDMITRVVRLPISIKTSSPE